MTSKSLTNRWSRLRSSRLAQRLAKGSAWSLAGSASSRLLNLLGMILLARVLGQSEFGQFGMIQATIGTVGIMAGFGLGSTGTRFVAQYVNTDGLRTGRILGLINAASWCLVVAAALLLLAFSKLIASEALGAPELQSALATSSVLMLAVTVRGVQVGVWAGLERFDVIAKLNLLEGVLAACLLLLFAHLFGVHGALLGLCLASVLTWAVGSYALRGALRDRDIQVAFTGCWSERRILSQYSLPSFLSSLVGTPVLWFCMTRVVQQNDGFEGLAIYNAAYQWHGPLMFLPMITMSVSMPILVQQWTEHNYQGFRRLFLYMSLLAVVIAGLPALLLVGLREPIMGLYGAQYVDGGRVLTLLLLAAPAHTLSKMAASALLGMGTAWSVLVVNLVWGAVLVLGALVWIPVHGALGLALAFMLAYGVLMITSMTCVVRKLAKVCVAALSQPESLD